MLPVGDVIIAFLVVPRAKALWMQENFALGTMIRRFPVCFNISATHFSSIGASPTTTAFPPLGTVTLRPCLGLLNDV